MKRQDFIAEIMREAAHNEPTALLGLIDWLVIDHDYPLPRLAKIAERRFGIPEQTSQNLFRRLYSGL